MDLYDMTIIGGGPTGLFGAFYASLREMRTKIIEALPTLGGQLAVLYPEKYIYDAPGYPKILAKDLVKALEEQAIQFRPKIHLEERVESVERVDGGVLRLQTNRGEHFSRTALISAGIGAFSPNRVNAPGVLEFEGKGVYYFAREKEAFRGKRVLIVGGGDSAIDWALMLKDVAREVRLIHRRDMFRAHERSIREVFNSNVEVKVFYEVKEVKGDSHVHSVTIFNNQTKAEETLSADAVLFSIGFKADLGPIKDWGLEIENRAIKVNARMETNLPGVFAGGDIAQEVGSTKLNLIAVGYSQAAIAVNVAKKMLDPKAPTFEHSSEKTITLPAP